MSIVKHSVLISVLSGLALTPIAYAERLEEGQALAKAKGCFDCHGKTGNSFFVTEPITPVIAGQSYEYLRKAMLDYKSGARSGTIMTRTMSARTEEEIDLLAEYYAAQERY